MSQLVPCPGCERHVRLTDANCPFCGRDVDAKALGAAYAPRRNNVNAGIKRAALFALGTGMAAACGGKTDDTGNDTQPVATSTTDDTPSAVAIYGAPVPPTSNSTTDDTNTKPEPTAQPLYGAPVTTSDPTTTTDEDDTTEIMAQPEYGAPIPTFDFPTQDVAIYGAPPGPPISDETLVDAGVGDAGADAAIPEEPTMDPDPTPQPVYGAPIYGAPFAD